MAERVENRMTRNIFFISKSAPHYIEKKQVKRIIANLMSYLFLPALIVITWWYLTAFYTDAFPTPVKVAVSFWDLLISGSLIKHLLISLFRVITGYIIAAPLAIILGLLIGYNRVIEVALGSIIEVLRPIPPIAWIPISLIWFGISNSAIVFIVFYTAFFSILINTINGAKNVDKIYFDAAKTCGAKRFMLFKDVLLPGALPGIIAGMRIGLSLAWAAIIAGELTAGFSLGSGVGYLITKYFMVFFSPERVLSLVFVIGLTSWFLNTIIEKIAQYITPWS